ncbi:hypothetical protein BKA81DRAFT_408876 [Phyllosticta paracitricarpa]
MSSSDSTLYPKTSRSPPGDNGTAVPQQALPADSQTPLTLHSAKERLNAITKRMELLGNLTPEMILHINQYLSGGLSLALAATCKDIRAIIPKVALGDDRSKKEFALYLNRDSLAKACDSEKCNDDPPKRACAGCKKLHSIDQVSVTQLFYPTKVRKCRGRDELAHLCEHRGLSWDYFRNTSIRGTKHAHNRFKNL